MPRGSQKVRSYVQSCEKVVTSLLMDSLAFNRLRGIRKTNKQKDTNVHPTMLGSFLLQNFALSSYMPCLFIFLCFSKIHELLPTHKLSQNLAAKTFSSYNSLKSLH